MTSKQERLKEVYNHLRSYFGIHTQIDFAESIHITRPALSSAMNGNEAYLTKNLFQKICAAYPGVFNLEYLLNGDGTLLSTGDAPMMEQQPTANNYLADIIAAKNETIASLQQHIETQNKLIATLQREIARLKSSEFSLLVADDQEPDK